MIEHRWGQEAPEGDLLTASRQVAWLAPNYGTFDADGAIQIPPAGSSLLNP